MMFRLHFLLPFCFFLFSISYLAFILSLGSTTMIGDNYNYDPGGSIVPVTATIILGLTALWLMITHRSQENGDKTETSVGLILCNITISIIFISIFRPVGFILSTGIVLYILILLNLWAEKREITKKSGVAWLSFTVVYLVVMYSVLRGLIKMSFWLARHYGWTIFREPAMQAGLVALTLALLVYLIGRMLKRVHRSSYIVAMIQTSVATTLSIYVVFRLMFLVQLPTGLLKW